MLSSDSYSNNKEITIRLYKESENLITLKYEDNGIGLPDGFDFTKTDSLGLQHIVGLVKQIRVTIERVDQPGTAYQINFSIA